MAQRKNASQLALVGLGVFLFSAASASEWTQYGGGFTNSRHQADEKKISPDNVGQLQVKWVIETEADVTSTPSTDGKSVFFTDWAGNVYRADAKTGAVDWSIRLGDYTGYPGDPGNPFAPFDFSRSTPAIVNGTVLVGNQVGRSGTGGAKLVALDKETGDLLWVTQLDDAGSSIVTTSPTVFGGIAYVGIAGYEEAFAAFIPESAFPCCFFRGSVVAVDVATGGILWKTYTAPETVYPDALPPAAGGVGRFSGNAVWGSAPAVDVRRKQLYVATGNNYSAPTTYHQCIVDAGADEAAQDACNPPDNHMNSILALDLATGAVNWSKRVMPFDTWNVACAPFLLAGIPGANPPGSEDNCAYGDANYTSGPDFDFAQAPILYKTMAGDRVGAGQKSGIYWSLDAETGEIVWSTRTGPGGIAGGHQWGSASDGKRIYTNNANSFGFLPAPIGPGPFQLVDGTLTQAGIFSAIDADTGEIIWQTANPENAPAGAPATVANGVMYACSGGPAGTMFALDAETGDVLWSFASGSMCQAGASVVDGTVYWGTGYAAFGGPGNKLYAFGL